MKKVLCPHLAAKFNKNKNKLSKLDINKTFYTFFTALYNTKLSAKPNTFLYRDQNELQNRRIKKIRRIICKWVSHGYIKKNQPFNEILNKLATNDIKRCRIALKIQTLKDSKIHMTVWRYSITI